MRIDLLFSIDDKFTEQMLVTLYSIYVNTGTDHEYHVWVIQEVTLAQTQQIETTLAKLGMTYHAVELTTDAFAHAPVSDRYPKSIYYRLLAQDYLPTDLDRVLYLDADILCINDLASFYQTYMPDYLYAASMHMDALNLTGTINKLRLDTEEAYYFNSGVLLMNMVNIRAIVREQDIFEYIHRSKALLLLPDQDVLNKLYGHHIKLMPDAQFNYDVRKDLTYRLRDKQWSLEKVLDETVFLHFCGKNKPWHPNMLDKYSTLYKHYQHQLKQQ